MCKAFSFIVTRRKVYWELGMDSHNDIKDKFNLKDNNNYCPCEISPKNNDYLTPDEWVFNFDDKCPDWWKKSHEKMSWEAFEEWEKEIYKIIIKKKIVHPFEIEPPKKITEKHIRLLVEWASVGDSVVAYIGSFFRLDNWKYTEKIKAKGYPFESAVKLWEMGLVPSFDGRFWVLGVR